MYEIIIREVTVDGIPGIEPVVTEHFKQRFGYLDVADMVLRINAPSKNEPQIYYPTLPPVTEPWRVTCGTGIDHEKYLTKTPAEFASHE